MKTLYEGTLQGIRFVIFNNKKVGYKRPDEMLPADFVEVMKKLTRYLIDEGFELDKQCKMLILRGD